MSRNRQQPPSAAHTPSHWLWQDILIPFGVTRLALLFTGYFSRYFYASDHYPQAITPEGWIFSSHRWLDIWGRWDTYWYMDIIQHGYELRGALSQVQSNIAFFPLYPLTVQFLSRLLPLAWQTEEVILGIGVLLSNALAIAALVILHRLVRQVTNNPDLAAKTITYLLLFPSGFYLSCFYTESLFLFLSVLAFWFASRQQWDRAAIAGFFLALTRPQGVLILIPLAWQYIEVREWQFSRLRSDGLWLLLIPAGLIIFLIGLYPLTQDLAAPFTIQAAWGKVRSYPWSTLIHPLDYMSFITPLDQVVLVTSLFLAILACFHLPSMSWGLYALLLLIPPLFTGIMRSTSRYSVVVFPLFMMLGLVGQRFPILDRWLPMLFLTLQILLMAAWSQFYWVG